MVEPIDKITARLPPELQKPAAEYIEEHNLTHGQFVVKAVSKLLGIKAKSRKRGQPKKKNDG